MTEQKPPLPDFSFVRLRISRCIPRALVESVKGRTFTPEEFFAYQDKNYNNPNNYLFALIDENRRIHGYLWAERNSLDGSLFVNTYSVDKEYWGKGEAIPKAIQFLATLKESTAAPRVFWITTNKKFFERHGFTPSKNVLMEYNKL
jgi:hypothetical protein